MPDPQSQDIGTVESMKIANVLTNQNAVAHQHAMNQISLAATGAIVKSLVELDAAQAAAILKTTNSDVASQISALTAAIAGGQVASKVSQTTPPETGSGSA